MPECCCSFCFSIYDLAKIKLQFFEINKRSPRLSSLKQRGGGVPLFFLIFSCSLPLRHTPPSERLEQAKRLCKRDNKTTTTTKKQWNLREYHIGRWIRRGSELSFRIFRPYRVLGAHSSKVEARFMNTSLLRSVSLSLWEALTFSLNSTPLWTRGRGIRDTFFLFIRHGFSQKVDLAKTEGKQTQVPGAGGWYSLI